MLSTLRHRRLRPALPTPIGEPLTWVKIRPDEDDIQMWGAFDGAAAYLITTDLAYPSQTGSGLFLLSVKRFAIRSDAGLFDSLDLAKAGAEKDRIGRMH